jgi:hypothetical protein
MHYDMKRLTIILVLGMSAISCGSSGGYPERRHTTLQNNSQLLAMIRSAFARSIYAAIDRYYSTHSGEAQGEPVCLSVQRFKTGELSVTLRWNDFSSATHFDLVSGKDTLTVEIGQGSRSDNEKTRTSLLHAGGATAFLNKTVTPNGIFLGKTDQEVDAFLKKAGASIDRIIIRSEKTRHETAGPIVVIYEPNP